MSPRTDEPARDDGAATVSAHVARAQEHNRASVERWHAERRDEASRKLTAAMPQLRARVDDALQEAVLRLLQQRVVIHDVAGWLYTVARHLLSSHLRAADTRRTAGSDDMPDVAAAEPDHALDPREALDVSLDCLRWASGQLNASHYQLIYLKYAEGLSYDEIALRTGFNLKSLGTTLRNARLRLRDLVRGCEERAEGRGA
jgi:RNA polymerase sigma factor (sigma-70 family)